MAKDRMETAWLIERANIDGTVIAPAQYLGLGQQGWVKDPYKAIRFWGKGAALATIKVLGSAIYVGSAEQPIATQHVFEMAPRLTDH